MSWVAEVSAGMIRPSCVGLHAFAADNLNKCIQWDVWPHTQTPSCVACPSLFCIQLPILRVAS